MAKRVSILLGAAFLLAGIAAHAGEMAMGQAPRTMANEIRRATFGKVETRYAVARIVGFGKPAVPVTLDLLWGRRAFLNEPRPGIALEALAKLHDESALPELRTYLRTASGSLRVPTIGAMLAIRHSVEDRNEAVETLNEWIRTDQPVDGLRELLLSLPEHGWSRGEASDFARRLLLDHPNLRGGVCYLLAESPALLVDAILTEFAGRRCVPPSPRRGKNITGHSTGTCGISRPSTARKYGGRASGRSSATARSPS